MTAEIKILDTQASNQIAAGEVVERPVSVVKELIENALDAGSTQIEITIEGSGIERIRVQDNGQGIPAEELPLAVLRHATSKIRSIDDLMQLQTLGFRGEALPSIASVSRLEIISRPPAEISGRVLRVEGGDQLEFDHIGSPPGTTITVDDLFYNTPARRKFLKSKNTEFGQISDVIGRLSLARPDVSFILKHPKVLVLQTPGRGLLLESIGAVLGQATARRLLPISCVSGDWQLKGYISPPDLVRSTKQGETLIVNQRIIRSNSISRAILEGYHTLIPAKVYPIVVLNLQIPPHEYDVNVHPTKMEIRFHKEKELMEFIAEGVRRTLLEAHPVTPYEKFSVDKRFPGTNSNSILQNDSRQGYDSKELASREAKSAQYTFGFSPKVSLKSPQLNLTPTPEGFYAKPPANSLKEDRAHWEPSINPSPRVSSEPSPGNLNPEDIKVTPLETQSELACEKDPYILREEFTEQSPLLALRPIGQVFDTYILASDGEQLVIFDQHAAHERINYERLLKEHQKNSGDCQMLLIPLPMEFSPGEEDALLEHFLLLNDMGFILEQFGTRTYLLRGIPAYSGPYQGETLLRDFLEQVLLHQIPPSMDQLLEEWIYMLACKESIKAKASLNLMEMEQLIVQLSKTDSPYTCPHGRPTMVQLSQEELERRFYRS
ncbi:DNA mismatch repair protein MutL [Desulfitobacterium dichloroeliminans LMG P-21439]|uniref:DNA mismatch repair protein MutL n=1 Tax=Desulfitobacterium dichloroeliminans (strain LMG P-21439 / DCA1) TaxID=871963 RepID=L0F7Y5_DESDL|nr:DNA mismatch repair endonuclease MutL [Desulfitobacterium dichloroeliminans]AGA69312.1 DNA mismatch repair protein MutL [Desulfitobacterium dichloroeliminans LMG P-21439]